MHMIQRLILPVIISFLCIMAWRSSGKSNAELVANLKSIYFLLISGHNIIKSIPVEQAMLKVDRGKYVSRNPYDDCPQPIGHNATISAPHMHAYCLELLSDYLKPGNKVLDVGSGSGYLTAVFAHMVQPNGHVVGIEHIKELCDYSLQNIKTDNPYLLKNAEIVCGDGRKGYPEQAPYDAIHVGASSAEYPTTLIDQLNTPGRLVVPVGEEYCDQYLMVITKDKEGKITQSRAMCVMYVPLTSPEHQLG